MISGGFWTADLVVKQAASHLTGCTGAGHHQVAWLWSCTWPIKMHGAPKSISKLWGRTFGAGDDEVDGHGAVLVRALHRLGGDQVVEAPHDVGHCLGSLLGGIGAQQHPTPVHMS